MAKKHYSEYIEVSPDFESVVDIDADSRHANLWREYIVGDDMEKMMEVLCQSLNNEGPDLRRSFWIEGTYGTGKSYAAILIKHLMEEKPDVVDDYLSANSRLAPYRNRFMKCRNKGGDYLVIWKTGCTGIRDGNALLMEAEKAVRDALDAKFGDKADYGEASLSDAVRQKIHSPVHNWEYIIENTSLSDDYSSVEELQDAIDAGDLTALQKTAAVIRQYNWGLVDSLETFKKWIATVIENNNLSKSGIFFIWDEFTEYVANSDDQTILQQLSEFCKVQPFFMLFIVHRTSEMVERITPERYQLITHRFHQVEFHISADAAFDLIAGSINIRNGMSEHWKDERKQVIHNIQKFLPDMSGLDDKISEQITHLCPMHPMTIKLLSRVAENYAASQRTMFRFMKDQSTSDQGFVGYINKYGPDDQACWLTPEWLWDYFFTRESDFSDKDTKVAEYIRHYEESKYLVESDENALRVFKIAMLLLALMSTTKGIYSGKRSRDGIAATEECLATCLAGVMSKENVHDMLQTMQDSKILVLDRDNYDNVRLQLPFRNVGDGFEARYAENDKKYSRYQMFSKDGIFAQAFEKQAVDENDAFSSKRMKIAVCCAETRSIQNRLDEIKKELDKHSHKLGLLLVTVQSDTQANSIQSTLQNYAIQSNEPRLTIALVKDPLNDDKRKKWLTAITKREMANDNGQTGEEKRFNIEATTIVSTWVSSVVGGSKMIGYNGNQVFNNQYGMAQLRKTIRTQVFDVLFPYAPENVVLTSTAYKPCNDGAPTAGIQRSSTNSQLKNVLNALHNAGVLELTTINEMAGATGNKAATSIAALASLIRSEMESGRKVNLGDLWTTLQKAPYGYYDSITCGVLLGYVFSCYKNSKYTWTDSAQSPHVLAEVTLGKMVSQMVKGKMTTDYLSAGSVQWQNFSEYLEKIFNLTSAQLAEQTTGYHNTREAVSKSGAPFWALKYLPKEAWANDDLRNAAEKVIDSIQVFISQEGDIEGAMSNVLQLLQGRGKVRVVLGKSFQDKNVMAAAFRTFLFSASPELKEIATKLAIQPEELSDKIHSVMQGAIYTWTEDQVTEKLSMIAGEYRYLEAICNVQGKTYHSIEEARKDIANLFKFLRIPIVAIEQLKKPWYPALQILYKISRNGVIHMTPEERQADIEVLEQYGKFAKECLVDGKPILGDILASKQIEYTQDELVTIYAGLKDLSCDTTLTVFERELQTQIGRISFARNKVVLQETWRSISGTDSIRAWCTTHETPLLWIVPKGQKKVFETLLDVQTKTHTVDSAVVDAIQSLRSMDNSILTDDAKIEAAFLSVVGAEYADIWSKERASLLTQAKLKLGNDMSMWSISDLSTLQRLLKTALQDKAKKEKLAGTKKTVCNMKDSILRERVTAFLDKHPEFCDDFAD